MIGDYWMRVKFRFCIGIQQRQLDRARVDVIVLITDSALLSTPAHTPLLGFVAFKEAEEKFKEFHDECEGQSKGEGADATESAKQAIEGDDEFFLAFNGVEIVSRKNNECVLGEAGVVAAATRVDDGGQVLAVEVVQHSVSRSIERRLTEHVTDG